LGNIRELSGKMHWGTKTNIGYYSQNLEGLDARNEVIQELRRVAPTADNGTLRGFLAKFLFVGEDVFKPVSALSGGEKGRLALAKLIYSQKNVLVLDEPTNHLDIPSRESLESALQEYDGTIIVVSHDRFFLDEIANQILAFEKDGSVTSFDGNYSEYHDWKVAKESQMQGHQGTGNSARAGASVPTLFDSRVAQHPPTNTTPSLSKNQRQTIQKRMKSIEIEIPQLEAEAARLSAQISDPAIAADYAELSAVTERLTETEAKIRSLYEKWEAAAEQLV